MSRFGLVGPSYASQSPNLDAELLMNMYIEADDGGAGNAPLAMYPTPGTSVFANLQTGGTLANGVGPFDKAGAALGSSTAIATPTLTPANSNTFALFFPLPNAGALTPGAGWASYGPQPNVYSQVFPTAMPIQGTSAVAPTEAWVGGLALFKLFGAAKPTIRNVVNASGGFAPPFTYTSVLPTLPGDTIIFANLGTVGAGASAAITLADNQGNIYNHIIHEPSGVGGPQLDVFILENAPGGNVKFTIGGTGFPFGGWASFGYALEAGSGVNVTGPIRGEFFINGRAFVVAGPGFVEILANGTFTIWGEVSNDGLPVTMAASPQQLLLASAGTAYVFDLMANTLTPIPGVTFDGPVAQAGICDDFFLLTIQNSKEFYVSAPLDATDWVTNGSAIVSVFPDNIVSMLVFQRQVWFFSDTQSVAYYDSGNIFPFDVNPNAFIEAGCAAENSPVIFNNSIGWLGSDARGSGKVWLANGYTPTRISNHAIEFAIQSYSKISDVVGFSYQDQGHEFYALYFPTPSVMWLYDAMTGMWHQRGFWVESVGQFRAAHYQNHIFAFGKHLVGDWQSANVYQMAIPSSNGAGGYNFVTDAGNPIRRVRRAPHISREQKWQFHAELQIFLESGLGPVPAISDTPLVVASDNFNRANENPLNPANWTTDPTLNFKPLQVVGNLCEPVGPFVNGAGEIFTGVSFPPDQFSQVTVVTAANSNDEVGLVVRSDATMAHCYFLGVIGPLGVGTAEIDLQVFDGDPNNAESSPFILTGRTVHSGDIFKLQVVGQVISAYQNGVLIASFVDANIVSGAPGLFLEDGDNIPANAQADNWLSNSVQLPRDPRLMLRWSDDSAHTWSSEQIRDCGQAGQYDKRVRFLRLGRSRDRIYEISMSDPIPWRIIDGYLQVTPGSGT